jgi:hypothetical protein
MDRRWAVGTIGVLAMLLAIGASARGQDKAAAKPNDTGHTATGANQTAAGPENATTELAAAAIDRASKANKYIFLFFYRADDEPTQAARKIFDAAMEKLADRAASAAVNITDVRERALVAKYGLNRSPMPLVLAMAPNGAVTRGFPRQFTEAQLETAFVSPGMQKCLRALQDRKMVFVCVQNESTQHNTEAMQGVHEFAADPQYAKTSAIVTVDPADAAEESFLKQLKADPKTSEAVTVFLAPPGTLVGTYTGETKKDVLVAAAKTAAKGCAPGGSCCPAPKKPATPSAERQGQPQQPGGTKKKP